MESGKPYPSKTKVLPSPAGFCLGDRLFLPQINICVSNNPRAYSLPSAGIHLLHPMCTRRRREFARSGRCVAQGCLGQTSCDRAFKSSRKATWNTAFCGAPQPSSCRHRVAEGNTSAGGNPDQVPQVDNLDTKRRKSETRPLLLAVINLWDCLRSFCGEDHRAWLEQVGLGNDRWCPWKRQNSPGHGYISDSNLRCCTTRKRKPRKDICAVRRMQNVAAWHAHNIDTCVHTLRKRHPVVPSLFNVRRSSIIHEPLAEFEQGCIA